MVDDQRRALLRTLGITATIGLSGCSQLLNGNSEQPENPGPEPGNNPPAGTETTPEETETPVDRPNEYVMALVPGENQELRQQIPQEQLTQYQQEFGDNLVTESTIFSQNTDEEWRQKTVDLLALEWMHDNDYQNIEPEEGNQFVESIGTNSPEGSMAFEAKNNPKNVPYPNSEGESNTYGHFDYEKFSNSESVGEALDWVQIYLFNWQRPYDDPGPISTEDKLYAAVLQESLDRHTEIESHFWSFDLPEASLSTHGNGLVYDQTNNELRVMETISGPVTQDLANGKPQYHPRVENSNYLNEEHDAYNKWWHPLRFAEDYQQDTLDRFHDSLDFKERKFYASAAAIKISNKGSEELTAIFNTAPSTEYIVDFTDKLRNWNDLEECDEEMFEQMKDQAKVWQKLSNEEDKNYVIYGTVNDPNYAKVESQAAFDRVWEDQAGEFDDFEQHLEPANA